MTRGRSHIPDAPEAKVTTPYNDFAAEPPTKPVGSSVRFFAAHTPCVSDQHMPAASPIARRLHARS